jgi:3',5'-cyclic AMP phosphodiesterase CpdA
MSDVIHIAQITDCHLPADPKQAYRGIDPYKNLQTLLTKVKSLKPDLVLASGDLSEDGSQGSYTALKHLLNSIDVPVLALPGNHDDAVLLAQIFPGRQEFKRIICQLPWSVTDTVSTGLPGKSCASSAASS